MVQAALNISKNLRGARFQPAAVQVARISFVYFGNVRSHFGERLRRVAVHAVDVLIGDFRLLNIEVVSDEQGTDVILGRNVLNRLLLVLDGPSRSIEVGE